MISLGAAYQDKKVCTYGQIITGNGTEASAEFARAILDALK
jgi:putative intracellular protease/amidase